MKPKFLGIVLAISAAICFGLLPLSWGFVHLPLMYLVMYRCLFTFVTLGVILVITGQWLVVRNLSPDVIKKAATPAGWLGSHFGFFMGGIALGYQAEAAIGMFLAPAATIVLSTFLVGEKLTTIKQICVAISVCAAILFFCDAQQIPIFAVLIAVLIAVSWGAFLCTRKEALAKINNPLVCSWLEQSLIGGVAVLILNGVSVVNSQPLPAVNGNALLVLGGGCALATIASFLQAEAGRRIDCSQVGMLGVLSPVVQFVIAIVVHQKPISLLQVIAIALLLIAVILYNCPPLKSKVN